MDTADPKTELARRGGMLLWGLLFVLFTRNLIRLLLGYEAADHPISRLELLRVLLTALSLGLIVYSYSIRSSPRVKAVGWRERVFPLVVALLGFGFFQFETAPPTTSLYTLGTAVCIAGWLLTLWSFTHLKRSFSILAEVRELVKSGPYAYVRHPLYAGEMINWLGLSVLYTGLPVKLYVAALIGMQALRATVEEAKLADALGADYASYRRSTGFLWPRLRGSGVRTSSGPDGP